MEVDSDGNSQESLRFQMPNQLIQSGATKVYQTLSTTSQSGKHSGQPTVDAMASSYLSYGLRRNIISSMPMAITATRSFKTANYAPSGIPSANLIRGWNYMEAANYVADKIQRPRLYPSVAVPDIRKTTVQTTTDASMTTVVQWGINTGKIQFTTNGFYRAIQTGSITYQGSSPEMTFSQAYQWLLPVYNEAMQTGGGAIVGPYPAPVVYPTPGSGNEQLKANPIIVEWYSLRVSSPIQTALDEGTRRKLIYVTSYDPAMGASGIRFNSWDETRTNMNTTDAANYVAPLIGWTQTLSRYRR